MGKRNRWTPPAPALPIEERAASEESVDDDAPAEGIEATSPEPESPEPVDEPQPEPEPARSPRTVRCRVVGSAVLSDRLYEIGEVADFPVGHDLPAFLIPVD